MAEENAEFNWIQARKDVGLADIAKVETFSEKFSRKFKENPLIPIGAVATTIFLTLGVNTLRTGDIIMSQKMMRGRVLAQGFTIAALLTGVLLSASRNTKKDK